MNISINRLSKNSNVPIIFERNERLTAKNGGARSSYVSDTRHVDRYLKIRFLFSYLPRDFQDSS